MKIKRIPSAKLISYRLILFEDIVDGDVDILSNKQRIPGLDTIHVARENIYNWIDSVCY